MKKSEPVSYRKTLSGDLLFNNSITAMMLVDGNRVISVVNKQFCSLFGYQEEEIIGLQTAILTPSKVHFERYRKYFEQTWDGSIKSTELQYKKKSGELFWVKLTGIVIPASTERYILWSFDDVSNEVRSREEIKNRYLELDIIFNKVPTGLVYVVDDIIERANPSFLKIVEAQKEEVIGRSIESVLDDFTVDRRGEGKKLIKRVTASEVLSVEQETESISENSKIMLYHNVTQHVLEKKALQNQASIDSLTGLLNRGAFEEKLQKMLDNSATGQLSFALFDIDHFKLINDNQGHAVGDKVLIELGALLKGKLRDSELLGRVGGEEFAIALPVSKEISVSICKRLLSCIRDNSFTENNLAVTVSMGLVDSSFSTHFEQLYREADRLLYHAKRSGRDRLEFT